MKQHKQLWKEAFGSSDKYIDFFFRNRIGKLKAFSQYENGELSSMTYLDPNQVNFFGNELNLSYVTGVATKGKFRKQGRMKLLLKSAFEEEIEKKKPLIFVATLDEKYYYSLGFRGVFYRESWQVDEFKSIPGEVISFGKMQTEQQNEVVSFSNDQLRQGKYDFYTMRNLEYCRMQYKGMKALRGDMVGIYNQGHELFAVVEYFIQQGKCCVQEMICKERMDSDAINLLNAYVNGKGLLPKDVIDVLSSTFSSHNMERTKMLYMMARILDVERFVELVPLKVWRQAFPHVPEDRGLTLIISDNN